MIISRREAAFIAFLCFVTTVFFSFLTWKMQVDNNIGGLIFSVFFLSFSVAAMIFGAIDFAKTIIQYRKHNCKYGNVKAGDCISGGKYGN